MIDGMAKKILFYGLDMLNHAIIIMTSFLPPFIRDEKKLYLDGAGIKPGP